MGIRVVRLGTARARDEGLRIGTVRRPPRGVARADYSWRDYFDVWLPELAPSAPVVSSARAEPWTPARWRGFARLYHREMREPRAHHLIATLAALSHQTNFSVGCYCADATRCHRRLLRDLLLDAGAVVVDDKKPKEAQSKATAARSAGFTSARARVPWGHKRAGGLGGAAQYPPAQRKKTAPRAR